MRWLIVCAVLTIAAAGSGAAQDFDVLIREWPRHRRDGQSGNLRLDVGIRGDTIAVHSGIYADATC